MKGEMKQPAEVGVGTVTASDKLENGFASESDVQKDTDQLTLEDIREQIRYIEKAVATKELNYISRVLRGLVSLRRKLNHNVLRGLVQCYFPNPSPQKIYFLEFLPEVCVQKGLSHSSHRPWTQIAHLHHCGQSQAEVTMRYCRKLKCIFTCCYWFFLSTNIITRRYVLYSFLFLFRLMWTLITRGHGDVPLVPSVADFCCKTTWLNLSNQRRMVISVCELKERTASQRFQRHL